MGNLEEVILFDQVIDLGIPNQGSESAMQYSIGKVQGEQRFFQYVLSYNFKSTVPLMMGRCDGYGVYLFRAKNHRVWIKGKTLPVKKIHQKIRDNISLEKFLSFRELSITMLWWQKCIRNPVNPQITLTNVMDFAARTGQVIQSQ